MDSNNTRASSSSAAGDAVFPEDHEKNKDDNSNTTPSRSSQWQSSLMPTYTPLYVNPPFPNRNFILKPVDWSIKPPHPVHAPTQQIKPYTDASPLIHQMPVEIIAEIMLLYLSAPSHTTSNIAPLLLTQICSRWRAIALSTPRLWASIHVTFRLRVPILGRQHSRISLPDYLAQTSDALLTMWQDDIKLMQEWIARSKPHPLNVTFGYIPEITCPIACIDGFFDALLDTAHRWETFDMTLPANRSAGCSLNLPLRFVSRLPATPAPLLRAASVQLAQRTHGYSSEPSWMDAPLLQSPHLRRLVFARASPPSWPARSAREDDPELNYLRTVLPRRAWGRLTSLAIECVQRTEVKAALKALRVCTGLESLSFRTGEALAHNPAGWDIEAPPGLYAPSAVLPQDERDIVLPGLKTLELDLPADGIMKVLGWITTPALESLTVQTNSAPVDVYSDSVGSLSMHLWHFLERSELLETEGSGGGRSARIRTLTIDPVHYSKSALNFLLEALPGITSLTFKTKHNMWAHGVREHAIHGETSREGESIDDDLMLRLAGLGPDSDGADATGTPLPPSSQLLLPLLEDISFFADTKFSANGVVKFLQTRYIHSRIMRVAQLQRVQFAVRDGEFLYPSAVQLRDLREELQSFKEIGLQVVMKDVGWPEEGRPLL